MTELKKEFELYLLSNDCGWCDGREWQMGTHEINNLWNWIEQKIDEACKKQREIIADKFGLDCPNKNNCNNGGALAEHGCDGTSENCERTCPVPVQCEFCYCEEHSKFNYLNAPSPKESV